MRLYWLAILFGALIGSVAMWATHTPPECNIEGEGVIECLQSQSDIDFSGNRDCRGND